MTQVVLLVESDDPAFVRWWVGYLFEGVAHVTSVSRAGSYRFRRGVLDDAGTKAKPCGALCGPYECG